MPSKTTYNNKSQNIFGKRIRSMQNSRLHLSTSHSFMMDTGIFNRKH